ADNTQIVQSFNGPKSGMFGTPAFWQNGLYIGGRGDKLKQFIFDPSTGQFTTTPYSQSSHVFNFPGASPSVSSQGASNGIIGPLTPANTVHLRRAVPRFCMPTTRLIWRSNTGTV